MRELITNQTSVGNLINQIDKNAKTFYVGDDVKICLRLEKRCDVCKKFYPKKRINHKIDDLLVCDWCREGAEKGGDSDEIR